MRVGLVQMNSGADVETNLRQAEGLIEDAVAKGAEIVALPEVMHLRVGGALAQRYLESAEAIPGPMTERFAGLAKQLGVYLLLGSICEVSPQPERMYNTSVLINPQGEVQARYRKIHLFDVQVDEDNADNESARYHAGVEVVAADTAFGKLGLTICYDLRFPELFRALALLGSRLVFVPANFTRATGEAHWMTLLRARAIENGLFIVAPAQTGRFPEGFEAFGRSAAIDPWGRVLVEMDDQPGVAVVDLDLHEVDRVRTKLPMLKHLRPDVYFSKDRYPRQDDCPSVNPA